MKFRLVIYVLGLLLLIESVAMLACGTYGFFFSETKGQELFLSAGICFLGGALMTFLFGKKPYNLPKREGITVVGLSWIAFGLFGALPFCFAENGCDYASAFFEAVSGFTTTGSTVLSDLSVWGDDILLWRALTQWLGGLGILVLFVALLSSLGAGTKFLFRNESTFQPGEVSTARIHDTALTLLKVYLSITIICLLGLKGLGMNWYEAVTHALTTCSTGGFSPYNESIAYFSNWKTAPFIELWLTLFMFLCSINFLVYVVIISGRWNRVLNQEESRTFGILILLATLVMVPGILVTLNSDSPFNEIRQVLFMVVSVASTTGFGLIDYELWPTYCLMIMAGIMVLGGCAGSTSGGLKVGRFIVLLRSAREAIVKAFRPNRYVSLKVNGNTLTPEAASQTVLFVALYFGILLSAPLVVSILEIGGGIDLETSFGAVIATLSNIGPGFGDVGPTENFSHFNPATKIFLSLLMILGRLELFALLALIIPETWKRF